MSESRVDRGLRWIKNLPVISVAIVIGLAVIGLASFSEATTTLSQRVSTWFEGDPLRDIPPTADFQQWAADFRTAQRSGSSAPIPRADEPGFSKANGTMQRTYGDFVHLLREGLTSYRKTVAPNLYLDVPALPISIFGPEAANYRGVAIFSRKCSWFITFGLPQAPIKQQGPTFRVEFMDGDGHAQGAKGVGAVEFFHDFQARAVQVRTSGVVTPILAKIPSTIQASQFKSAAAYTIKLLIEQQVSTCHVETK